MAITLINLGTLANDDTGTKPRPAGELINGYLKRMFEVNALTDATTIAVDASLGRLHTVTISGNRTLGNPTNALDGQALVFALTQDGTGGRTLALGSKYRLGTDITSIVLSTTAGKTDYLGVIYRSGVDKFDVVSFVKGF